MNDRVKCDEYFAWHPVWTEAGRFKWWCWVWKWTNRSYDKNGIPYEWDSYTEM